MIFSTFFTLTAWQSYGKLLRCICQFYTRKMPLLSVHPDYYEYDYRIYNNLKLHDYGQNVVSSGITHFYTICLESPFGGKRMVNEVFDEYGIIWCCCF